jgi:hypothetical protein
MGQAGRCHQWKDLSYYPPEKWQSGFESASGRAGKTAEVIVFGSWRGRKIDTLANEPFQV